MKKDITYLLKTAEKFIVLDRYVDAEAILLKAMQIDSSNPECHYLLGEALCKQGRFRESVKSLKKADLFLPNHPKIWHLLGWATFMNGDSQSGRKLLKSSLKQLPSDVSILCDLAVLENQEANSEEAMNYALKAIELEPENPMAQEVFQVVTTVSKIRSELTKKIN